MTPRPQDLIQPALKVDVGWAVGVDGKPYVTIPSDIPTGSYTPDTILMIGKKMTICAERAQEMMSVWKWLLNCGIEREQAGELLKKLSEAKDREILMESIKGLGSMF